MIESKVRYTRKTLLLPVISEAAPITGAATATKNVEMPKAILYRISGACLSRVSQRTKYSDTMFKAKNWFARSYNAQDKIKNPFLVFSQ